MLSVITNCQPQPPHHTGVLDPALQWAACQSQPLHFTWVLNGLPCGAGQGWQSSDLQSQPWNCTGDRSRLWSVAQPQHCMRASWRLWCGANIWTKNQLIFYLSHKTAPEPVQDSRAILGLGPPINRLWVPSPGPQLIILCPWSSPMC